ncbi:MAG: Lrp/AsnC family transcriptional regulator [Candidatus Micrarchaeota archaeon]|nr:Lrp/AsnC family transcriptional regulator [Candidatus Micrarchaeota archaeon]
MELKELDGKDRQLLFELDMGCRQSYSLLSRKIGLSKQSVEYRIRGLVDKGIIRGFYTVFDVSKLGYMYSRLFVQFHGISPPKELEIVNYLLSMKEVGWVISSDGMWDLNFGIWSKNVDDLALIVDQFLYKYGSLIKRKEISITTKIHHFQAKFLLPVFQEGEVFVMESGAKQSVELDALDYRILSILALDARVPLVTIAKKLSISYKVIGYRLRRLEKKGIILCYRADINFNALKYGHYKVFLTLHNNSKEREEQLRQFLRMHPNVIYVTKALSMSDLEFECIIPTTADFFSLMRELRAKFFDVIQDHSILMLSETHQINYLPIESKTVPSGQNA